MIYTERERERERERESERERPQFFVFFFQYKSMDRGVKITLACKREVNRTYSKPGAKMPYQ